MTISIVRPIKWRELSEKPPVTHDQLLRRAKQIPRVCTNPATFLCNSGILGQIDDMKGSNHD